MHGMGWRALGAAGIALAVVTVASAQQGPPVRIRGQIEKVEGKTLTIKARNGSEMKVNMIDNPRVQGLAKASLADIDTNSYIGVTAMPQPDGSQKAIAIHIFMPSQRGLGEGFRAWDLQPNSTMTNAAVASKVAAADGNVLTMKYKGGEKKVIVTPQTTIVKVVPGDKSEIKAGAQIIIMAAKKEADGSLTAPAVYVGVGGVTPPM